MIFKVKNVRMTRNNNVLIRVLLSYFLYSKHLFWITSVYILCCGVWLYTSAELQYTAVISFGQEYSNT